VSAQTLGTLLQQVRTSNAQTGLPTDVTLIGTLTDQDGKVQSIQIQIKGKDKIRYDIGTGKDRRVTIFNANEGWTIVGKHLQALPPHASVRRPSLIPVLDLLTELENPKLLAADQGLKVVGTQTMRQVTLLLPDQRGKERALGRKLDETVEFYFDPTTMLILRTVSVQRTHEDMDAMVSSILDFSNYQRIGNVAIPFRIVNTTGSAAVGARQSTLILTNAVLNTNIQDIVFTPAGGLQ
jgi:hypothetical protein